MNQLTFNQPGPAGLLYHATVTTLLEYGRPDTWEVEYCTTSADSWTPTKVFVRYFENEDSMDESLRHYLSTGDVRGGVTITALTHARATTPPVYDPAGLRRGIMFGIGYSIVLAVAIALLGIIFRWWGVS